jgi:hypothetical protein
MSKSALLIFLLAFGLSGLPANATTAPIGNDFDFEMVARDTPNGLLRVYDTGTNFNNKSETAFWAVRNTPPINYLDFFQNVPLMSKPILTASGIPKHGDNLRMTDEDVMVADKASPSPVPKSAILPLVAIGLVVLLTERLLKLYLMNRKIQPAQKLKPLLTAGLIFGNKLGEGDKKNL